MEEMIAGLKASVKQFVNLTENEEEAFISPWSKFEYNKNTVITDFGQTEKYFYYVHKGVMRGYFIKNGIDYNMGFSYDGEYSGVFDSFLDQSPAVWALETITPTYGLRIEYQALMKLYDDHKVFERWARLFYQRVLVGYGVFSRSILADTAEEKFNRLVKQSPHVLQLIPQKHLASYLGMTPETFSRMRKKAMS